MPFIILHNLLIILSVGLVAGMICKRFGFPMVIGYLLAGALIGEGGFGILSHGVLLEESGKIRQTSSKAERESVIEFFQKIGLFTTDSSENTEEKETRPEWLAAPDGKGRDANVTPPEPTSLAETNAPVTGPATEPATKPVSEPVTKPNVAKAKSLQSPALQTDPEQVAEEAAQNKLDEVISSENFQTEIIDELAHLGALFLLFSIGIHFAPSELFRMKRFLFVGGPLQMVGVILPIVLFFLFFAGGKWQIGLLVGFAVSLSSTVLVFKSLEEAGQAASPIGTRALAILLFQDIAMAPMLLLLPFLQTLGTDASGGIVHGLLAMGAKGVFFVVLIVGIRFLFNRQGIHLFGQLKSVELMVLFTVVLLFGVCLIARRLEFPAALGAFAAGVALSENRLTNQFAAVTIPFRETFSAIFFVSLGALFDAHVLINEPLQTLGIFFGLLIVKTAAGALAFRILGLSKTASFAMGLGISQLGELSFIVLQDGTFKSANPVLYQQLLFSALTSIILTPLFLKIAFQLIRKNPYAENSNPQRELLLPPGKGKRTAIVVGLGPIGSRITSFLEVAGADVCLVDMNPVNLHPFAQEGFRTVSGDARDIKTLKNAGIDQAKLVVLTIPDDHLAMDVLQAIRGLKSDCSVVARCRYTSSVRELTKAGATMVICEESEAGSGLVQAMEPLL